MKNFEPLNLPETWLDINGNEAKVEDLVFVESWYTYWGDLAYRFEDQNKVARWFVIRLDNLVQIEETDVSNIILGE